ncbi:MAG: undecaprenyl/decaprenyl-phosphate alpha-N-acetylglucosaminyl 1-phosphate transferase [Armatimonadota bacterium]|nr:MAG: undecaprenyl/decaprenyl-phosphate alpha-N-acetylglucosaminyl 1-phosphate transferase [Armatimonadota bacterium]
MIAGGSGAILVAYLVGAGSTCAATPLARALAVRIGALDRPNDRKIHERPLPTWGGVAIIVGFLIAALAAGAVHQMPLRSLAGIVIGALLVALIGFVDDRLDLSAKLKLVLQTASVIPLLLAGLTIEMISHPFLREQMIILPPWASIVVTIVWVVGVTNAINLIDGLDGLAAGVAAISCVALASIALGWGQLAVALLCAALAGAAIGFLPWNWHPASILMGDTGAYFLGYVIAAVTIQGAFKMAAAIAIFVPLLVLAVPLLDTALSPLRRILSGRPAFSADRDHLHHRLVGLGLSESRVVLLTYLVTAVCSGIAVWISRT